jgi:para-nitrobenzyl esterase
LKKTKIIETDAGKIQGYFDNELLVFKGIPYAEPPIEKLRLKAPVLKNSWEGLLEAQEFSPIVPQPISPLAPKPYPKQDEANSLTLNIWTPSIDEKKYPVMVWIHGGSFLYGSGTSINVSKFVQRGNVIVVTINYRLGAFANLVLPDAPGNIDMLDQISALTWIRRNIEFFGGDPENITIFGVSAGGQSVCILMAMTEAKGLFHHAIAQSGRAAPQSYKLSDRKIVTKWLFEELNLKPDDLEKFRKLPYKKIAEASAIIQQKARINRMYLAFGPYIDGKVLPEHPLKVINKGINKDIELIIGSNREEWKLWHLFTPNFKELESNVLPRVIEKVLNYNGEDNITTDLVINTYRTSREENKLPSKAQDVYDAFITDLRWHIPAIKFAEARSKFQKNTYMYLFSWQSPYQGGKYGAAHSLETSFVFNTHGDKEYGIFPKRSNETEALSEKIMDAWVSFAKVGDPNHENIPKWPQYEIKRRATIVFDNNIKIWEDPLKKERELWNRMRLWANFI